MDLRRLMLGLWEGVTPKKVNKLKFTPKHGPENYFAVVDLYRRNEEGNQRRKVIVGSWILPVTASDGKLIVKELNENDAQVTVKEENPYSEGMRDSDVVREWQQVHLYWADSFPFDFALWNAIGEDRFGGKAQLRISLKLFRRDNMKSTRLLDDCTWEDGETITTGEGEGLIHFYGYGKDDVSFSSTEEGPRARLIFNDDGYSAVVTEGTLMFSANFPSKDGIDEVPTWLINCREARNKQRHYHPSSDDLGTLAGISHFEFTMTKCEFHLRKAHMDGTGECIGDQDEMLGVLEGLSWE